jgi:hypothetical protein
VIYEFWDLRSNNLINAVSSENEAREMLRCAVDEHGEWAVEFLMLIEDDLANDTFRRIGIGSELLVYIREAV